MNTILTQKKQLRKKYIKRYKIHKNQEAIIYRQLKKKINKYFISLKKKKIKIMVYLPFQTELPILSLLNYSFIELYYPQIYRKQLIPIQFSKKINHILRKEKSEKKIRLSQALLSKKKQLKQLDYIIVPGLFIDNKGNRLGRGGGYYDRTLRFFNKKKTIFIARQWQVIQRIPTISTDIKINTIITEKKIYKNNSYQSHNKNISIPKNS